MPTYQLFGIRLRSDFPFASRMVCSDGPAEVALEAASAAPPDEAASAVYESPYRLPDGRTQLSLEARSSGDVFTVTDVARFCVSAERIGYELLDETQPHAIEILTLGTVMSLWLERRGLPALHAAAVVAPSGALGFLATNKGGKTSLAASLMQLGHPLLSDDILPLEVAPGGVCARPGYPQMRLWPDQAQHFLGSAEGLEIVHPDFDKRRIPVGAGGFGDFHAGTAPLRALYLPERGGERVEIETLPLGAAVMALIEHSFLLGMPEAMGLEAARFGRFAQLARRVPVSRLRYPDGVEHLPRVRDALLEHAAKTAAA